jgi:hypothetical protein
MSFLFLFVFLWFQISFIPGIFSPCINCYPTNRLCGMTSSLTVFKGWINLCISSMELLTMSLPHSRRSDLSHCIRTDFPRGPSFSESEFLPLKDSDEVELVKIFPPLSSPPPPSCLESGITPRCRGPHLQGIFPDLFRRYPQGQSMIKDKFFIFPSPWVYGEGWQWTP